MGWYVARTLFRLEAGGKDRRDSTSTSIGGSTLLRTVVLFS